MNVGDGVGLDVGNGVGLNVGDGVGESVVGVNGAGVNTVINIVVCHERICFITASCDYWIVIAPANS